MGGDHRRIGTEKRADIHRIMIGNDGEGQGERVGRLDRLHWQCGISFAAAFDAWFAGGVPRIARTLVGCLVTT